MRHEHLPIDEVRKRNATEHLCEQLRHVVRVLGANLTLEAVHSIHHVTFMVATRHEKVIRIEELVAEHCENALDGERATIHEITIEQIRIRFRGWSIQFEDVQQIIELAVHIATDREFARRRHIDIHECGLLLEIRLDHN